MTPLTHSIDSRTFLRLQVGRHQTELHAGRQRQQKEAKEGSDKEATQKCLVFKNWKYIFYKEFLKYMIFFLKIAIF